MTNKYTNGMYKTTSSIQDKIFNCLFISLNRLHSGMTASINFNQITGIVIYEFIWKNGSIVYAHIDYKGNLTE